MENRKTIWTNKKGILERYENLNKYTLNRWLQEMKSNKKYKKGIINPTHKIVMINLEMFQSFLIWKQKNKYKNF